jgi:parallel beta-helix repeat protein
MSKGSVLLFAGACLGLYAHLAWASPPPVILFTDVQAGPVTGGPNGNGVPISLFGKRFGATQGTSTVTIGGVPVVAVLEWGQNNAHNADLDMIVVQPGGAVTGGPVVVTVGGQASNADNTFTPSAGNFFAVAPTGSDGNNCTLATPCATIGNVTNGNMMKPGDTLLVHAGNYADNVWIQQSGDAGQPKTIKNFPGEVPVLTALQDNFALDASFVTVSGLTISDGSTLFCGRDTIGQRSDRFVNNTVSGSIGYAGFQTHGDDHVVAGNVCNANGSSQGTEGQCFYISFGSGVQILHNRASGEGGYGIHIYDEPRQASDFARVIQNVLVDGNVSLLSPARAGMIVAMVTCNGFGCYANQIDGVTIINNIFTENDEYGLHVEGVSSNVHVYNNTFYQNGTQGLQIDSDPNIQGVDVRNNLFYQSVMSCTTDCSGNLAAIQTGSMAHGVSIDTNYYYPAPPAIVDENGNPLDGGDPHAVTGAVSFADGGGLDLHLLAGSAPIGAGVTLASVTHDFDGVARPQGPAYAIGAFEYVPPCTGTCGDGGSITSGDGGGGGNPDAGPGTPAKGGCGCTSGEGAAVACGCVLLLLGARRRKRS